ncbi:hypothetical protein, partial [Streptomyces sp. SID2119]|uniref:hypothetical protein n=1 Tax=Streptomyces sp. SID2119 TaxID=2690253 RepID=UPI001925827B
MLHIGMETGSRTTATNPTTTTAPTIPTRDPAPAPASTPADQPCDLVTVPARQGLEAVDILRRGRDHEAVGPVLHNGACDTLGFIVPPGTADAWDVPGSACTRTDGRGLRLPTTPPAAGSGWLL